MREKYVVPEEGLKAAHSVSYRIAEHDTITAAVREFVRWQSENPPEITEEMRTKARGYVDGHSSPEFRYMFKVAYLAPQPEVPEEIKDLLNKHWVEYVEAAIVAAFHRGQKAGLK
jgi:hypothetical protein